MRETFLGDYLAKKSKGIVPNTTPDAAFELYSVPSFESRHPEIVRGSEVGSNKQVVEPGTVLLCKINPRINRAWYVGNFSTHQKIASTEWLTFPPHEDVEPKYLAYYLGQSKIREYLAANASGVGGSLMRVKGSTVEGLTLPLPEVASQRTIVAEIEKQFSRLDEAVANLQRVKANLKRYRFAVLGLAFSGDLFDQDAGSDGGGSQGLPQSWTWRTYADIGDVTTGFTPPTGDRANFGGSTPFFKPTDLDAGDNVVAAREYLTDAGLSKGRRLRAGSVLVTCIGATIGKTGLARVECATNQQINAVATQPDVADSRFVYWWTVSPRGQKQIHENASATTLPILNKSKFAALPVPLPPLAEQRRIVAEVDRRVSIVREVEAEVDANLKRAQALRQATLAAAFSDRK